MTEHDPHSRRIGRRDLLLALAHQPSPAQARQIAEFFQFDRNFESHPGAFGPERTQTRVVDAVESTFLESLAHEVPPELVFWRLIETTHFPDRDDSETRDDRPRSDLPRLTLADIGRDGSQPVPEPAPLVPWPRLRRRMEGVWNRPQPSGEIDDVEAVARLGRGQALTRIPRRLRPSRVPLLIVILDRAERLTPIWRDQISTYHQIGRERGRVGLTHAWWKHGPPMRRTHAEVLRAVSPKLAQGDAVLVLGDLGLYASEAVQDDWRRLGEALEFYGVQPAALVPCPASRWPARFARPWRIVDWANPVGAPAPVGDGSPRRDRLLAMLSWTVRLEPALLREVRTRLAVTEADIGTEADVWNHPDAIRHTSGLVFPFEFRTHYQAMLQTVLAQATQADCDIFRDVVDIVRRRHASMPREIWLEEARMLDILDDRWITTDERARALTFTRGLRGLFERGEDLGPDADLRGWIELSLSSRVPFIGWKGESWGAEMCATFAAVHHDNQEVELPPGLEIGMLPFPGERQVLRWWEIRQHGEHLVVGVLGSSLRGSLLAVVQARRPWLVLAGRRVTLDAQAAREFPLPRGESFEIGTDCMRVTLAVDAPKWAYAAGRDDCGLWAAFRVNGIEQRMRWIPPGRFMMGSAESEVGRVDRENQHEVTLEDGYWLAETPCTQELWHAVMGTNPSEFKSPKRPLESVSWHDAQAFIERLNERIEDLRVELPTEEQWEYACRAGTTTATYAGDIDKIGANNAPVLDAIAWYGGNSGVEFDLDNGHDSSDWTDKQFPHMRAGTREVGQKQRNPWGLYDMLGNVWEWCADEFLRSAHKRGPERVIRGGSWDDDVQLVRAASRCGYEPSVRDVVLGFRLARGQRTAPGKPAEKSAKQETVRVQLADGPMTPDQERQRLGLGIPPDWASAWGRDDLGVFACVRISDVEQRMRWIAPGEFTMGSPDSEEGRWLDEGPQHRVELKHGYWLADTPCTQAMWQAVMGSNPSYFTGSGKLPVERVSWEDVRGFLEVFNAQVLGFAARLPSEAEWEYACRAGTDTARYGVLDEIAWYSNNSEETTHEVGLLEPNPWGLHDMLGNVDEWCADTWSSYEAEGSVDPFAAHGPLRVFRGGSWNDVARDARAAFRDALIPGDRYRVQGFRLARGQELRQENQQAQEPARKPVRERC